MRSSETRREPLANAKDSLLDRFHGPSELCLNCVGSSRRAPHGANPSQNRTCRFTASGSSSDHSQNGANTWSFLKQVYVYFRSRQGVLLHKQDEFIPGVAPSLAPPVQVLKQMLFYLVKEVTQHFPVIRDSVILVVSP